MTNTEDIAKKITVQVPEELWKDMRSTIPWGLRRHLIMAVLRVIIDAVAQNGTMILGAIMDGQYKLTPTGAVQNLNKTSGAADEVRDP